MPIARIVWAGALALVLGLLVPAAAEAARVRYHYVPADAAGAMVLAPIGPHVPGERINPLGRTPYCQAPRPTCCVPFRHPCTGRTLAVPLALPADTPTIEHRTKRVVYNYGSFTVEVLFLTDGSVDVIYNSGLLRDVWTGP